MKINNKLWEKMFLSFKKKIIISENEIINDLLKARFILLEYKKCKNFFEK
ncbi:Hypothetical protein WEOB_331 [Candidatus Westeberhardia cardiocondylae]|uniref:Uncharacterized protein n=1 Tax=Candidatus Westeberhardia cardiocondylae TaxID=1594731 RepID=A0A0H5BWY4_9ENTR|nr:Hypothetical protein WEOB_331 [Candidatus Westeberhardia cardiocondylae]